MRVLIVPMTAMAETAGSYSRTVLLAKGLEKSGIEVATCAAEDFNFRPIKGLRNYYLTIPNPLGLPQKIAVHTFPVAQKLGITTRKSVNSFDDVLYLTGNTQYFYIKRSVGDIRNAIRDFKPDVIYSEFNISAIVAGKIEHKRIYISTSMPTQFDYAHNSKYTKGLNRFLKENRLMPVRSCVELFSWADWKFVPSCYELEPFTDKNATFCGTFKQTNVRDAQNRHNVLVYMGNGTVSKKVTVREVRAAFQNSRYPVYIAGQGLKEQTSGNIHMAPYFDFQKLLPNSLVFINHGGQNSVIDGLIYGVPQIICAGKIFERKYNAKSVVKVGAGIEIGVSEFKAEQIKAAFEKIISSREYQKNAYETGKKILSLGGIQSIIRCL